MFFPDADISASVYVDERGVAHITYMALFPNVNPIAFRSDAFELNSPFCKVDYLHN